MRFGIIFFSVGVLVAISGAAKVAGEIGQWPNTVPLFLLGFVISLLGLVIWRKSIKSSGSKLHQGNLNTNENPMLILESLTTAAQSLEKDLASLTPSAICDRIDQLIEKYMVAFISNRQAVLHRFGMKEGARILILAANGERLFNRAWSAAADGYIDECKAAIPEAINSIENALHLERISP